MTSDSVPKPPFRPVTRVMGFVVCLLVTIAALALMLIVPDPFGTSPTAKFLPLLLAVPLFIALELVAEAAAEGLRVFSRWLGTAVVVGLVLVYCVVYGLRNW